MGFWVQLSICTCNSRRCSDWIRPLSRTIVACPSEHLSILNIVVVSAPLPREQETGAAIRRVKRERLDRGLIDRVVYTAPGEMTAMLH